jgi:hypothetical protein
VIGEIKMLSKVGPDGKRSRGRPKGLAKSGGRAKGTPNKTTALLKDAILKAAEGAGGKAGLVGYLQTQALENPGPFMTLLGKVLPMQVAGPEGEALTPTIVFRTIYTDADGLISADPNAAMKTIEHRR